jgi:ABC-type cobalt transport system substrate-binding protein
MIIQKKRLVGIIITVVIMLLIPLIAMQFTPDVNWGLFDFVAAGVLLLGAGFLCELILRKIKKTKHRIIIIVAVLALLTLTWLELAIGIFGTPFAGS